MASSGAVASPFTKSPPTEPPGPDLVMDAKKKGGGYPVSKACRFWNKKGQLLSNFDLEALTCCSCGLILRNPYQVISCGHRYCETCLEEIMQSSNSRCREDDEVIHRSEVRRDKGCTKEIDVLVVDCPGKAQGCEWKGLLVVYEEHVASCVFVLHECKHGCGMQLTMEHLTFHEEHQCLKRTVFCDLCNYPVPFLELQGHLQICEYHCPMCNQKIARSKFEEHKNYQCSEGTAECSVPGCGFKASFMVLNEHISKQHLLHLAHVITQLQEQMKKKDIQLEEQAEKMAALEIKCENITKRSDEHDSGFWSQRASSYARPDSGFPLFDTSHPSNAELATVRGVEHRVCTLEETVHKKLQPVVEQIQQDLSQQVSQLAGCVEGVQAVQETATRHAVSMEEIKLRQDILDVKTTTGVFIWKIPDIKKRHRDALDRRTLSLYSPPFHTSPHGYRICIRAYLNGDGSGKGTHISVFFVLMRSEQDNLLRWPFGYPVTFTLMNQDTHPSKSISETFLPDARSPSFQQPRSEMNIASGFPRFASQSVLSNESFTKGNAIFIKCRVDMKGVQAD